MTAKEKQIKVRNAFMGLIASHGYNLKQFCSAYQLDYFQVYQQLNRYKTLQLDEINRYVALLDNSKKIEL